MIIGNKKLKQNTTQQTQRRELKNKTKNKIKRKIKKMKNKYKKATKKKKREETYLVLCWGYSQLPLQCMQQMDEGMHDGRQRPVR